AHTKEENKDIQMFVGQWLTNCSSQSKDAEKICTLERSIFADQNQRSKLASVIFQTSSKRNNTQFTLLSPLGTLIQAGVKIGFDEKLLNEKAYAFNLCQQVGCITSFPVDKNVLDRFKKGKNLDLEYISPTNQKIKIKFNLDGFTKAFDKIAQN
ncbi:MAG: invasion associated locus B family protein, partial [Methylophilaceae bacterium]